MTNPFFLNDPAIPHFNRPGGLKGEIFDLRRELVNSFDLVAGYSGGGSVDYIFTPGATRNGNIYGDWKEMCDAIAAKLLISYAFKPIIRCTQSFTVPLAQMPAAGWGMANGTLESVIDSTGAVTITVPDGVNLDMLEGVSRGMYLELVPHTKPSLTWSLYPPGVPWIIHVSNGAACKNQGTIPAVTTPGSGVFQQYFVFALDSDSQSAVPANSSPIVKAQGTDVVIYAIQTEGISLNSNDGWAFSASAAALMLYITGISSTIPAITWAGTQLFLSSATDSAFLNQRYGTLADRALLNPLLFGPVVGIGKTYFATDLGVNGTPLWWNGTAWIDASGAIVP